MTNILFLLRLVFNYDWQRSEIFKYFLTETNMPFIVFSSWFRLLLLLDRRCCFAPGTSSELTLHPNWPFITVPWKILTKDLRDLEILTPELILSQTSKVPNCFSSFGTKNDPCCDHIVGIIFYINLLTLFFNHWLIKTIAIAIIYVIYYYEYWVIV